jgi:glycosidase
MRRTLLAALTAALLVVPLGLVALTPATADHTPVPSRVTLMGSLMFELGCASDWDENCSATDLERVDGTNWFTDVFTVPAGTYAYKVRLNGSWDENYGKDGKAGGADIPLVLENPASVRFSYDHETHRVTVTPGTPAPGLLASDRSLARRSLREPLTRERFYFVMADRFANGSAANDTAGITGGPLASGFDPTHKGFYHGGDLAGLTQKLDYINGMGTTAIWLTPSFKNRPVQGTGANTSAGYHGYWITDFTQVDPHFGTNAELSSFVNAAHARGMKVFFDIITNHTADVIDYEEKQYAYISKATQPYRDADGNVFDDRDYVNSADFPELDAETSFPYTPFFNSATDATVKVPAWLNDRTLYHNRGDSTFSGENSLYGDFFGLDDLFTEQPAVVDGMTDIYKAWVDFGIDGFRIDTVKHVNTEFWQQFAPAIQDHARAIGNNDFFSFGEVFDADPKFMSTFTTEARLQATLDFGFQARARGFAASKPTDSVRDLFALDDYYTDTDSNAYQLPTFLGNHDMGRIGNFIVADNPGASGAELLERDRLAHSLMYLTRGQPVVYYGDEQGFVGDNGGDQNARQDMFASSVASYNDDPVIIGSSSLGSRDRFDSTHPVYRHLNALSALVSAHPALRDGAQIQRYSTADAGVFAVSRIDAKKQVEYLVALNNATTAKTVQLPTFSAGMTFAGLWPAGTGGVTSGSDKQVTVTVPALSARVWKASKALASRSAAPDIAFAAPLAGGTVHDRAEIKVEADEDAFSQVSFAFRKLGSKQWTRLGTDDNAPYRVFHDVRGIAKGSLLEYRAVLEDSSGNLSVANTSGSVGDAPPPPPPPPGVEQPASVSVPGDLNSEVGCPGDWQPECPDVDLTLSTNDAAWSRTFTIPAGGYAYKVAINDTWEENYGAGAEFDGDNIGLAVPSGASAVTFIYDHRTHWIADSINSVIATVPGSFQSEIGCSADWDPACLRSWLQDPDGDGTYVFTTTGIPEGVYEGKVAHNRSWVLNYGSGGAQDGPNYSFTVPEASRVTFSYNTVSHVLSISTEPV